MPGAHFSPCMTARARRGSIEAIKKLQAGAGGGAFNQETAEKSRAEKSSLRSSRMNVRGDSEALGKSRRSISEVKAAEVGNKGVLKSGI